MRRFSAHVLPAARAAAVMSKVLAPAMRYGGGSGASPGPSAASSTANTAAEAAENTLPGVDLARRVASPSEAFPATWAADEPLAPSDPRVVWREHYSLAEERPYYHNVRTNETTHDIPEGFVTRFPLLYRREGFRVDANGAVFRQAAVENPATAAGGAGEAAADGQTPPAKARPLTSKQKLAAYGGGGLLWYLIVHNVCLAAVFSMLYFFKVDLVAIARSYGFDVKLKKSEEVKEVLDKTTKHPPFFKTFVLSVLLNKLLVPLQLVFTLATAPFLVHRLQPVAALLIPKCQAFLHRLKLRIKGEA